eukprot:Polyplicarium_translucidae@DN776_c0_g1_i1.p1
MEVKLGLRCNDDDRDLQGPRIDLHDRFMRFDFFDFFRFFLFSRVLVSLAALDVIFWSCAAASFWPKSAYAGIVSSSELRPARLPLAQFLLPRVCGLQLAQEV